MYHINSWTDKDVQDLIGKEENLRLEFKSGALMDKSESAWTADISKEVSALANSEGGVLVIGISEVKQGQIKIADKVDGAVDIGRDQLQSKIEGNLSPYLPGIRVHRVHMPNLAPRVVYVVAVPQGSTAYQASDRKYYGRSETQVGALPDHEIRLRMMRGRIARATITYKVVGFKSGRVAEQAIEDEKRNVLNRSTVESEQMDEEHVAALLEVMNARYIPDEYELTLTIENQGELTVREPVVEVCLQCRFDTYGNISSAPPLYSRYELSGETIYPGDRRLIPSCRITFSVGRSTVLPDEQALLSYRVLLDAAPPHAGVIYLSEVLRSSSHENASQLNA